MKIKAFSAFLLSFFLFGCAVINDSNDSGIQYGSLTIQDNDRALDTSELTEATVTVYGTGMTPVSAAGKVAIVNGKASATVDNIPVGKNRVVEVKSNLEDVAIYAVTDIVSGNNSVTVNWSSTALGAVYYNLIQKGTDVSSVTASTITAAIPSDVHASLVDAEAIAKAYPSLGAASSYKKATGTVTVNTSSIAGYKVQVTDAASAIQTVEGASSTLTFKAKEGNYRIIVLDSTDAPVAEKEIVVGEGVTTTVNAKQGSEITDHIEVFVPKTLGYTYCYAWTGSTKFLGEWAGTKMTEDGDYYKASIPAVSSSVIFSKSSSGANQTGNLSITKAGAYTYNGSSFETKVVESGVTITVENPAIVTKPTVSITPGSGEVGLSGTITVKVTDGNGTISDISVKANSKTYTKADFTAGVLEIKVSDITTSEGATVSISASVTNEKGTATTSASLKTVDAAGVKIYVSSTSGAPSIWAWTSKVKNITNAAAWPGETMAGATGLRCNDNWYVITTTLEDTNTDAISIIIDKGSDIVTTKTGTFWYDAAGIGGTCEAKKFYDSDPSIKPDPVKPTIKISPVSGKEIGLTSSFKVEASFGYDTITSNSITINGNRLTLSEGVNTYAVADYATDAGQTITVSATLTNSIGTASANATYTTKILKEDPFTWDNVNAYFVLTDRFYNGDTKNDHSYFRQNGLSGDEDVATFHGGDLAGLTQKLDYFDKLGVNAIWITAPYEQAHGWVGGKNGAFPHYAFHGYYTLDWSSMDQNMGTVEELRTFVNACHSKGIRVIMDVVMNHVGYNNTQDMITYKHGYTEHTDGWLAKTAGKWDANDTVKWDNSYWDKSWFGPWIRSFGYDSGSEYGGSCGGLPDVKTELTSSVGMAPVLVTKWGQEKDSDPCTVAGTGNTTGNTIGDYRNPSVANVDWLDKTGNYRTDMNVAPADYQVAWLSAWVREVGIDGFRCDTAKHVEPFRWGQLKKACTAALEAWRNDSTKSKLYNGVDTGAAEWDEGFWMTGEHFGWTSTAGQGDYYTTGGFDSMINFSFNGSAGAGTSTSYPDANTWSSYLSINNNADSDGNGNRNNVLTYMSSHDTKLCRPSDAFDQGTMFTLTPGGIQIYYGDESSRPQAYTGCGDTDMATRGDMNWTEIAGSKAAQVAHWGKVGNFRKYNPAVGAGTGSATKRTYSGAAGENKVAISISGTSVDVSGLFADGSTVYNWYDGKSAVVSGGKVTFAGGTTSAPILVSAKNPASCGLTF